jgi:heptose-I-phosphate ethanolaminephosphotransferase
LFTENLDKFKDALATRSADKNLFSDIEITTNTMQKAEFNINDSILNNNENQTFVLILGESTGRNHMSFYDYYRNTNPKLNSIKNQLYVFNNVVSPHSHTYPTLQKVLTFANFEDMSLFYSQGSMIELFKKAGFKTFWLSNQFFEGEFENETTALATISDKYEFVNKSKTKNSYDMALLKPLKNALEDKANKKFIIVHLLGTHGNYIDRYPATKNHFTLDTKKDIRVAGKAFLKNSEWGKDRINEYDNAVRYNDEVVFEMIQLVKKHTSYSYLMYLSDHGEEVYDCMPYMSHHEANATPFMFEIPFFIWLSDDYKKVNSEKVNNFSKYLSRKYQTDDLIHSILDLSNIQVKNYIPSKSIVNPNFKVEKRHMGHSDYDLEQTKYAQNRNLLKRSFDQKSLEKINAEMSTLNYEGTKALILKNQNWVKVIKENAERKKVTFEDLLDEEIKWAMKQ